MNRALTDEQSQLAAELMAVIVSHTPDDAFAAFASIMAATINNQATDLEEALARGEMWGQLFVDLLTRGRAGAFAVVGEPRAIDARFLL